MNSLGDQVLTLVLGTINSITGLILQGLVSAVLESIITPLINAIAAALGLTPM